MHTILAARISRLLRIIPSVVLEIMNFFFMYNILYIQFFILYFSNFFQRETCRVRLNNNIWQIENLSHARHSYFFSESTLLFFFITRTLSHLDTKPMTTYIPLPAHPIHPRFSLVPNYVILFVFIIKPS